MVQFQQKHGSGILTYKLSNWSLGVYLGAICPRPKSPPHLGGLALVRRGIQQPCRAGLVQALTLGKGAYVIAKMAIFSPSRAQILAALLAARTGPAAPNSAPGL